jgi:hypothetical protein
MIICAEQILGDCLSSDDEKADGDEDDLVSLNNNPSGRGKEGGGVDKAHIDVGRGKEGGGVDEAQIVVGRGKEGGGVPSIENSKKDIVCNFFSRGKCNKGEKCLFRHEIDQGICNEKSRGKLCTKRRNSERSKRQSNGGGGRKGN